MQSLVLICEFDSVVFPTFFTKIVKHSSFCSHPHTLITISVCLL